MITVWQGGLPVVWVYLWKSQQLEFYQVDLARFHFSDPILHLLRIAQNWRDCARLTNTVVNCAVVSWIKKETALINVSWLVSEECAFDLRLSLSHGFNSPVLQQKLAGSDRTCSKRDPE